MLFLDIETSSTEADTGIITGIGLLDEGGRARFLFSGRAREERKLIKNFLSILKDFDVLVTWRGRGFDIPFLITRAIRMGEAIDVLQQKMHIDLADVADRNLRLGRKDLYHVCRYFGIPKKGSLEGMDMPKLYIDSLEGSRRAERDIRTHCLDDLYSLRAVYWKLKPLVANQYRDLGL